MHIPWEFAASFPMSSVEGNALTTFEILNSTLTVSGAAIRNRFFNPAVDQNYSACLPSHIIPQYFKKSLSPVGISE